MRLTGDPDTAQDAAQEAFARLVASPPPRNDQPRAWLFTVATNVVRGSANALRRRRVLLQAGASRVPAADPPRSPEELAEAGEVAELVRRALADLTERERTLLLMREEGFTHREIARAIGTTTGSVGTMIARALDRLAEALPLDTEGAGRA